jgi:NAD(P)-dependent dehydrogenase (short-subunit alcohol dehydrogenase family)
LWKENEGVPKEAVGKAEDIGDVVATICSSDGRFMNGEVYQVHGGFPKL